MRACTSKHRGQRPPVRSWPSPLMSPVMKFSPRLHNDPLKRVPHRIDFVLHGHGPHLDRLQVAGHAHPGLRGFRLPALAHITPLEDIFSRPPSRRTFPRASANLFPALPGSTTPVPSAFHFTVTFFVVASVISFRTMARPLYSASARSPLPRNNRATRPVILPIAACPSTALAFPSCRFPPLGLRHRHRPLQRPGWLAGSSTHCRR